tara:strand:+ start:242 stop:1111 length:870 start_codon:yes stop_codon:yes gene_type:complete
MSEILNNITTSTQTNINEFGNSNLVAGNDSFLFANTFVAKFAFFLLVLIILVFILKILAQILARVFEPSPSPILYNGVKDAKKLAIVPQNPNVRGSIPILRSNNEVNGIEFTYSIWLYIDDLDYNKGIKKHIFHKGNNKYNSKEINGFNTNGVAVPNNAPGLYLAENSNKLIVVMNTFDNIIETIDIDNIPLNKWFNVVIRNKNKFLDVFINGTMAARHTFNSVPKQNYGDIYINDNGGFSGKVSTLRYFNEALNGTQISKIITKGPDMTINKNLWIFPPYLSFRWFFN